MKNSDKTLVDILKIAIKREEQAFELYSTLAEKVTDHNTVKLFRALADDESRHKDNLQLEIFKTGFSIPEIEEVETMLQEVPENKDIKIDQNIDIPEILLLAIGKEKAAFRFYVALSTMVQGNEAKNLCLELAEEEARHKSLLEIEFANFNKA